jgi:cell division protein FtsN
MASRLTLAVVAAAPEPVRQLLAPALVLWDRAPKTVPPAAVPTSGAAPASNGHAASAPASSTAMAALATAIASPPGTSTGTPPTRAAPMAVAALRVRATPASGASFALQAGRYAAASQPAQAADLLLARGIGSQVMSVSDSQGSIWWLVTIGSFSSWPDALPHRAALAERAGLPGSLPVVLAPAPAAAR